MSDVVARDQKRCTPTSNILTLTDLVESVRRKYTTTFCSRHHHQLTAVLSRRRSGREYGHHEKGHSSFGEEHDCQLQTQEEAPKKILSSPHGAPGRGEGSFFDKPDALADGAMMVQSNKSRRRVVSEPMETINDADGWLIKTPASLESGRILGRTIFFLLPK